MFDFIWDKPDLLFALALIVIALVALILSRLNMMPAKGWPFLIGAVFGISSVWFLNRAKARILKKQVAQLDAVIEKRRDVIKEKSKELATQGKLVEQAEAEYQKSKERLVRSAVEYHIKDKASYEKMSDDQIRDAFNEI